MSENTKHVIEYGSAVIEFELQYKNRKTLGIKVYPECSVVLSAPLGTPLASIYTKLTGKMPWVLKQRAYFERFIPRTPERKYIAGETHLYLGRQYLLKIELTNQAKSEIKFDRNYLTVYTKNGSPKNIERLLEAWYKQKAALWFEKVLASCKNKFPDKYTAQVGQANFILKKMSKRWGSCAANGHILLNTNLIKAPKSSIEYVVIHELCHLIYHNHNKSFYQLQSQLLPDWEKWKDRLEYWVG